MMMIMVVMMIMLVVVVVVEQPTGTTGSHPQVDFTLLWDVSPLYSLEIRELPVAFVQGCLWSSIRLDSRVSCGGTNLSSPE